MLQKRTKKLAVLLATSLLTVLFAGCAKEVEMDVPALKEPVSVNVDTFEVKPDTIYQMSTIDGEIIPVTTEVVAEYGGILGELFVKEGDLVEEGQLVAQLSDAAVQSQLAMVQSNIDQTSERNRLNNEIAQCDIDIMKLDLADARAGAASKDQIREMEYRLELAEMNLRQQKEKQELAMGLLLEQKEELEAQVVDCDILATASGRVAYLGNVREGNMVLEGTVVAIIASEEKLQVRTDFVSDASFRNINSCHIYYKGQEIEIANLPYDRNDYVRAALRNGSFYTYYDLSEQPSDMVAGDYAQIRIIKNRVEDALVIPLTSLYRDGSTSYVYVIDENGNRVKVIVSTGIKNEIMIEIIDGLQEGDKVYVKN